MTDTDIPGPGSAPEFATLAVRAGQVRTHEGEHSEPIFTTSSFVFASAEEAAARFSGATPGNVYSRFTNPTVRAFETRLAALEGARRCIATASGMSAIMAMTLALLRAGDHMVVSRSVFGASLQWFEQWLPRFGIEVTLVPLADVDAWTAAMRPNTRILYLESPSNPLMELADLSALSALARSRGAWLAIDNCFCTPVLQRPFEWGADIVIHSATKYLDGQGRVLGGALLAQDDAIADAVYGFVRTAGPCMSAINAWVFLKGLETLPLRMRAHSAAALQVAEWLERQPGVERVYFPGLVSHPQFELARRQQSGPGGMVSFELCGGRESAWALINQLKWFSITANLGDTRSTVTHPATTTHGRLSEAARAAAGICDSLVRLSVGLEDVRDLIADLSSALHRATPMLPRDTGSPGPR
jgi:O-succinylhomoserine sulfhydrylase